MDADEFDELKGDTLDVFDEDVGQTLEYHEVLQPGAEGASEINQRFGFTDTVTGAPATKKTDLLFSHVYFDDAKGRKKSLHKAGDEYVGDYDAKIYIPTDELERKQVTLKRDNSFLKLPDGEVYTIAAIYPIPRMYGTSVVNKLYVTKKKPIQDRPGNN